MKQIHILIADSNEDFAFQIQNRIESEIGAGAEVTIISDREYLYRFFETPRKLDILLIDEDLYFRAIERHNIEWIYILTEESETESNGTEGFLEYINRFVGLKAIVDKILSGVPQEIFEHSGTAQHCKMIVVTSPSGGCGKTTTALALSASLWRRGKKVLFADVTSMQHASFWLRDKKKSIDDVQIQDHLQCGDIKKIIEHNVFDYVCPFSQPLLSMGVSGQDYREALQSQMQADAYDYIVVDVGSDFSQELAQWISMAHFVVLMTMQDLFSVKKLQLFRAGIDCSDADKFRIVCGLFRPERKNYLRDYLDNTQAVQYIPYANLEDRTDLKTLAQMQCYKSIAARFM